MRKAELSSEEDAQLAAKILLRMGGDAWATGSALLYEGVKIPEWIPYRPAEWEITDYDLFTFHTHWG